MSVWGQRQAQVRFDWGPVGAATTAEGVGVAVVVDVLSFSTTTSVAVERGARVLPYRWGDEGAAAFAVDHQAILAGPRSGGGLSLSPVSMAASTASRVVLPSPNGATIAWLLEDSGVRVAAGCLRNAGAVAQWLIARGESVAVIGAGERWPDGSLRPAVEDQIGAGAIIAPLVGAGWHASPEAISAAAAFKAARDLRESLMWSASGIELVSMGYELDVAMAAELDAAQVVPLLDQGGFEAAAQL